MMRALWWLVTVFVLIAIALFARWKRSAADDRAVAAERDRIRRLVAQPGGDESGEPSKNES